MFCYRLHLFYKPNSFWHFDFISSLENPMLTIHLILLASFSCKSPVDEEKPAVEQVALDQPWPDWAFHHWVWEDESTQESLMAMVDGYEENDIPVGAVIIDSPWATGYSTYEWDTAYFPDPQAMIDALHSRDIRVMLWTVPMINTDVVDLYQEASDGGYFLTDGAGGDPLVIEWWKGEGSLIDYFNPEAVEWWHELINPILDMGIDGWKTDGAEYELLFYPGFSSTLERDVDRLEYSRAYYSDFFHYSRERLGDEVIITARPIDNYGADFGGDAVSFAPTEINFAGWVGDQDPDFEGLRMALRNMYWSADYGYLAFGSDIGGYRSDETLPNGREKEPFIRWAQMGAFCPVMENGGSEVHWPWLFDQETTDIYRTFTLLHYQILDYINEQGKEAYASGKSIFQFTSSVNYSYLLGNDLFVAPILEADGNASIRFPEGDWVYLFDDSITFIGDDTADLEFPLAEFPVYLRSGSDLATQLLGQ
jgi:alpha-glucosidase (family GH31 glycosyl hydrolase)